MLIPLEDLNDDELADWVKELLENSKKTKQPDLYRVMISDVKGEIKRRIMQRQQQVAI